MSDRLMSGALLADLGSIARGRLTPSASLGPGTWFRVGGEAELLFQPADSDDLVAVLAALPREVPVTTIGVGSNILIREGGAAGLIVRLSAKGFGRLATEGEQSIRAGAAVLDKRLGAFAQQERIGGLAFFHGIPGTVGGAVRMNAGANGIETSERLVEATAIDRSGAWLVLTNAELGFGYRHSSAPDDLVFVEALLAGEAESADAVAAAMAAVHQYRETAQPIREKTGGSTFKNPPGDKRAWELIEAAGCRSLVIGDAEVSPLHCNFLINRGDATSYDLELLGETVRARVLEQSGIRLDWEIKRIGRFEPGEEVAPFLGRS